MDAHTTELPAGGRSAEDLEQEVRRLRGRLTELERELVETQAMANSAVAHWQERAYWLERWHLDLNAVMRKPGAMQVLAVLRAVRSVFRGLKRATRLPFS